MKEHYSFPKSENFGEIIKEKNEPVKNLVESLEKIYYFQSKVTQSSKFNRSEGDREGQERPMFLRKRRADILHQIETSSDRSEKENLLAKAKALDEITAQYLNQQDVSIRLPEFGEESISARIAIVKAPEEFKTEEDNKADPIFFIPGISNDIECVNNVIAEIAMQGRDVITVGYPEGFSGHITEDFVKDVEQKSGVDAHAAFFKEVFNKVQKEFGRPMEMWGLSMGAPITAKILNDPEYQEKVSQAVLLFPAQSVDMSSTSMTMGSAKEFNYLKNKTATLNWTVGTNREVKTDQLKLRKKVLGINVKKMLAKDESWKTASVREGGVITVVSGLKDEITKSYQADEEFKNGDLRVIELPDAHHMTINIEPEEIIEKILTKPKV